MSETLTLLEGWTATITTEVVAEKAKRSEGRRRITTPKRIEKREAVPYEGRIEKQKITLGRIQQMHNNGNLQYPRW